MQPSLVIWDWNGTLLDDRELCIRCLNQMLAETGCPNRYDDDGYREVFGFPVVDYYRRAGFDLDRYPFDQLAQRFMDLYLPAAQRCGLCPGALSALTAVQRIGAKQIILSASELATLRGQVAERSLSGFFDKLLGQSDIYAHSKEETGLAFLRQAQIDPASTVFVGDTLHDFQVASAMGVKCVLCAAGHHSRARLETAGVPVIDTLRQLPAAIQAL